MQISNITKKTRSRKVIDVYGGLCPECASKLVFAESSFYCPSCGFCETDFVMEQEKLLGL